MRVPQRFAACITIVLLVGACSTQHTNADADRPAERHAPTASAGTSQNDLDELVAWMSGSFSSAAQAAADPDYRDIRLHMTPIWTDRHDARWLYVEQALSEKPEKPYRQRVYRVSAEKDGVSSEVYSLPGDPLRFAGAWKDVSLLATLSVTQLAPREGCAVHLHRDVDGSWSGSTIGQDCPSELAGATHATSEVHVTRDLLTSWDRGFDAAGKQVWGATKGPYRFVKER